MMNVKPERVVGIRMIVAKPVTSVAEVSCALIADTDWKKTAELSDDAATDTAKEVRVVLMT